MAGLEGKKGGGETGSRKPRVKAIDSDDWLEKVKKLDAQAEAMTPKAQKAGKVAEKEQAKAQEKIDNITAVRNDAGAKWMEKDQLTQEAKDLRKEAKEKVKAAEAAQAEAADLE